MKLLKEQIQTNVWDDAHRHVRDKLREQNNIRGRYHYSTTTWERVFNRIRVQVERQIWFQIRDHIWNYIQETKSL